MAAEVVPLPALRPPPGPPSQTPDQTYWRTFRSQLLIPSPQSAPITHITTPLSYLPPPNGLIDASLTPDAFAVTTGSRVTLISARTRRTTKTITRLSHTDTAYSAQIRRDGRIVLASGSSGAIQAFDSSSRAVLKTWREHKQAVWSVAWNPVALTECLSASDDRSVRTWDLPSEESTVQLWGHEDYVRTCGYVPNSGGKVLVSGSYDGTVRVWDARSGGAAVMRFDFAEPVESVLPLPDGATVAAAAGDKIGVLDLAGRSVLQVLRNHQKTVTCLSLASQGRRVVSGGLDGHVKVFDATAPAEWKVVAGFKYPSPVLSVAVIPAGPDREDRHLAVGMQSGLLSLRTRLSGEQKVAAREKEREMQALADGTIDAFDAKRQRKKLRQGDRRRLRGKDFTGEGADIIIADASGGRSARGRIRNQSKWESALRKGQWATSLDLVLNPAALSNRSNATAANTAAKPDKQALLTLLTALQHRSALRAAIQGGGGPGRTGERVHQQHQRQRDETTLGPLYAFLARHVSDPRHTALLSDVALVALDVHGPFLGGATGDGDERGGDSSAGVAVAPLVAALHRRVRAAVEVARVAGAAGGMLDFVAGGELA